MIVCIIKPVDKTIILYDKIDSFYPNDLKFHTASFILRKKEEKQ